MKTKLFFFLICIFIGSVAQAQRVPLKWEQVAPGIWKATVGQPDKVDLLGTAGGSPRKEALQKLGEQPFPLPLPDCNAEIKEGKVYLRFPLQAEEQLFGLGLQFKTVNRRGQVLNLHMDHYGGSDNGRSHAPVPFYISSKGYGVLINSARYITVYAGSAVRVNSQHPPKVYDRNTEADWSAQPYSDAVEMLVPTAGTEVYVFAGNTPMEVVQRYNLFNGGGVLPPKWGLGFTHRMPTLSTADQVEAEAGAFKQHGFPLDFIGLEPGWQTKAYPCTFEWDKTRFPDPAGFVKDMKAKGIRLNLWLNPYLSPASSLYEAAKPLSGSHTVWNGLVPDLTLQPAQELYKQLFRKQHVDIGVSGYKIDEVDGYDNWLWPDVATFPSGTSAEQMRQLFGVMMQRATAEWFKEKGVRTYGLVRASNAGASSLPYVIYNDYYNHRDFITALCNSSFIGVLWTPEVRASKTAEEWLRRMQSACFSPMAMLNAWADGTKPWSFPEVEKQVKDVALLRMQLFPYLYTVFSQYYLEGKPPVRAMNLVEGFSFSHQSEKAALDGTENPYQVALREDVKDQFMLGDNLLVAPMFAGQTERKVILPQGKWYDFYTGEYVGNGSIIVAKPGLDKIPLYVKDGGIIPMIPPVLHTPAPGEQFPLEVRHYGEAESASVLYDDDGESYDYQQGKYMQYQLSAKKNKQGKWQEKVVIENKQGVKQAYKDIKWRFMLPSPQK
ncbi:glycoside hydrolase family 31 protein [Chitinophaga polysaccharea]|uniref:glycoside hydrolase family 31 protein n=1 Tax=Chitinophaga polysaccharea TaxID=1293035 RepID=UPI001455B795|nr:TIM-barrel domain-containing protein [Chitinophaga polysaccharea]NLR62538.1 glycoside hydrolase family 31 protein [Chitinophaga polysaccharea]